MFQHQGIWLPDGEKHFPEWMTNNGELVGGKGTYQMKKIRAALPHCKNWRVAVDVGAHVGLWSMHLTQSFAVLHAFEPVAAFRECWFTNMASHERRYWFLHEEALGAGPDRVAMKIPPLDGGLDTGGTHVCGHGDIEMRALDSYELADVDFVKIDCEGFEHHVIFGARETIKRCRPAIIVEQKAHKLGPNFGIKGTPAVDLLTSWGYQVRAVLSGDYILTSG